jgi:hypothetical protein
MTDSRNINSGVIYDIYKKYLKLVRKAKLRVCSSYWSSYYRNGYVSIDLFSMKHSFNNVVIYFDQHENIKTLYVNDDDDIIEEYSWIDIHEAIEYILNIDCDPR